MRRLLCVLGLLFSVSAAKGEPMEVDVDATDAARQIYHVRLTIPTKPGPLTLHYPRWLPGSHGPTGPLRDLVGLRLRANGKTLDWKRDEIDLYSISCDVPEGCRSIEVSLSLVAAPATSSSRGAGSTATPRIAFIKWYHLLLYPQCKEPLRLPCRASLRLPEGWKLGTALPVASRKQERTTFETVPLEMLMDSPVLCGQHFREIPVGPNREPRHWLILACDSEAGLDLKPAIKTGYDQLVTEALTLFGAHHYRSYRFLIALSDHLPYDGLEHHESGFMFLPERTLIDDDLHKQNGFLPPHEYIHSWVGKHRRPVEMMTRDYQQPQKTRLLWVYEGLTTYLHMVLSARSGLWNAEDVRDELALLVERYGNQTGRGWRPLEDTAICSQLLWGSSGGWRSVRRAADYYQEGALLWLEVDAKIRHETKGKRSLDDFCRAFFGGQSGPPTVKPYTLDEVIAALNDVAPHDWKTLLMRRVSTTSETAPLEGIVSSGWRLAHGDKPTALHRTLMGQGRSNDLTSSLGMTLSQTGTIGDVIVGKPAERAGAGPGMKIIAVNGRRFSSTQLQTAILAAKTSGKIELLLENGDFFRTHTLEYRGGPRYPRLERIADKTDLLTPILTPARPAK